MIGDIHGTAASIIMEPRIRLYHCDMSQGITGKEAAIRDRAKVFARKSGKSLSAELTDVEIYPSDPNPVSVFIREARSSDKKRVYKRVINDAIELQDRVIKEANSRRTESAG